MHYKILCSDLDGTLLTTKSDVSDFTISEIKRIKDKMRIILVSARMPKAMTYIQKDLGIENEPLICYNGALVLKDNKELYSTSIDVSLVEKLNTLSNEHAIKLGLYYKDEWYVETKTERVLKEIKHTKAIPSLQQTSKTLENWKLRKVGAHKIMLMGTLQTSDKIYPILLEKFKDYLNIYRSNDTLIEVTPKAISKLSAIKILLSSTDTLNDVIAFGDNYNDAEMLEFSGYGVAVGNAREKVKKIADNITLENTKHGVAEFIKRHL